MPTKKPTLDKALNLHKQGDLDGALFLYQQIIEQQPQADDVLHLIGIVYAQQKKLDKALKFINKAITIHEEAAYYNSLGNVQRQLRQIDAAIEAYDKATHLKKNYAMAYNNLGLCHYQQGHLDKAQQAYETALKLSPIFTEARYNYGLLLAQLGDNDKAIENLLLVINDNPEHEKAYSLLGQLYLQQHKYDKAIQCFDKKLMGSADDADTYHDLGLALLQKGEIEEAIKVLEKALSLNTSRQDCNHNLATAYLQSGDQNTALNYYFRQIQNHPSAESYYNIGVLLMNQNRHKEALNYLEYAAELDPEYLATHINLGALYLKQKNLNKAIAHYEKAAQLKPNDAEITHILAALSQQQTPEAAPKEYLQHLFDQYATFYDKHLTQGLNYKVPQTMAVMLFDETGVDTPSWTVLDLGCGTGLSGEHFKNFAKKLIGVDLSEKMVEIAKQKNIYDELKVADISAALDDYQNVDLIVAADVFTYIGNLELIFAKCQQALNPQGLFCFTVESTHNEPYILQRSIRYAHSKTYLQQLIEQFQFQVLRFDNIVLRLQEKKPVEGYVVLLKK